MRYKEYEEQWYNCLTKIEKQGYKLKDCKVGLGANLRLNLNSEVPLLRSTYVSKHYVMSLYDDIMTHINTEKVGQSKDTILLSYKNSIISNFSCVKDVDDKLHFTVDLHNVNWVTQVPVIVGACSLVAKRLCGKYKLREGQIVFNCSMIRLTLDKDVWKKLRNNYKHLEMEDHYFKMYGILSEFEPTLKILNYVPKKNCFDSVAESGYVYVCK